MGIGRMLERGVVIGKDYIQDNLKELFGVIQSATERWLLKTLQPPQNESQLTYEDKVDYQTHYYDFFYNLETILNLVQNELELNYDDLLLSSLQIYCTSFPSLIDARVEAYSTFQLVLDTMKQVSFTTLSVSQQDLVDLRKKIDQLKVDLAKAWA